MFESLDSYGVLFVEAFSLFRVWRVLCVVFYVRYVCVVSVYVGRVSWIPGSDGRAALCRN